MLGSAMKRILALAVSAVVIVGCTDLALGPGAGEPARLVLTDGSGETVARWERGSGAATGEIGVPRGATRTLRVSLETAAGAPVAVDGLLVEILPRVMIASIATASLSAPDVIVVTAGSGTGSTSLRVTVRQRGEALFDAFVPLRVS